MVEVYLKTNKNYEANGDITLSPSLCTYKDREYMLTVEHPMDELERWKFLAYENVIKSKGKLYRIYNVLKTLYSVVAYARPIFFDLIDSVLLDVRPTNKNGQKALEMLLEGTGFKGHSNIARIRTSYNIRKNIVEALIGEDENSFINRWGGEFYCENFDVYINDRIGNDYGVRVEFGYNLNEIEEDINIEDVATRIIPVGFDGLMLKGNAPWVDSPLIKKYTHPKMRVIKFEDVKVKENKDEEDGFNTIEEARAELIKRCKELYDKGIDKPKVNYKIDMVNLANTTAYKDYVDLVTVGKGDTVTCYVKSLDIEVKARVIDFERDELTGEYNYIELGNSQSDFFEDQADIENRINKILNNDGTVNAIEVAGVLNAINVKMRAIKDIAQKQEVRALLCEDLDPESPTYGAMCYGTMGFMIASERTPDNRDWNWRTFGTGKGFFADLIVAGTLNAELLKAGVISGFDDNLIINLDIGSVVFKKGWLEGKNIRINLDNGEIVSGNLTDPKERRLYIRNGEVLSNKGLVINAMETIKILNNIGSGLQVVYQGNTLLRGSNGVYINGGNGGVLIESDFHVTGNKNCIQETENYGERLFYSVEDCESYLTDRSMEVFTVEKTLEETYERVILLDNIFKEAVRTDNDYTIEIFKQGWGDYRIKEQTKDYFIIEADRVDFTFKYVVTAKRRGFEKNRLEEFFKPENVRETNIMEGKLEMEELAVYER